VTKNNRGEYLSSHFIAILAYVVFAEAPRQLFFRSFVTGFTG
jgi:hypothetical protein